MTKQPINISTEVKEKNTLDNEPETGAKNSKVAEQPKNCNCVESRHLEGAIACPDCAEIEQPNQNLMIMQQVDDCIITHKAWQDNNLKHLKGAFE